MFPPRMSIQEKDIVSATKAIIETHVAAKRYYNFSGRTIENTTIRVHYTTETTSKLLLTLTN